GHKLAGDAGIDKLGAGDFSCRGRNWTAQGAASRGSFDCRKAAADISSSSLSSARRLFRQQGRDSHEVVGEHSRSNPQLEAVMSLGETSLHAATSEQHRDAPLDAGAKALALLEVRALLVGFALRTSLAAALRNAHDLDAITLARCQVLFAEEAAIRAIQFRDPTKGLPMVPKGRSHMDFVGRVSLQHLVLRDQALCAFGEKDLVAELDGRAHLASLDQVGVRFKNGINLLAVGYLFAIEHAATRLIDRTAPQLAKVLDLFAEFFDGRVGKHIPAAHLASLFERRARVPHNLFGNTDEHAVCRGLLLVALPRGHPLDRLHPTPRRTPAIAKSLDSSQFQCFGQA